jgi:sugar/nucleoside kinase (ribokinase family)
MVEFTVIGHVAIDRIITSEGERTQLGGPPTYVSLAARVMGHSTKVVTKVGEDFPEEYLEDLRKLGIDLVRQIGSSTTRFVLDYRGDERVLSVERICGEISPEEVSEVAGPVLVSAIVGEIRESTVSDLEAEAIALDPQGFLREVRRDGTITLRPWMDRELFGRLNVLKSSEEELKFITSVSDVSRGLRKLVGLGVEVAIATRGIQGSMVCTSKGCFEVPAAEVGRVVDSTGAGDVFIGAFLPEYLKGEAPRWCASLASAMASCIVQTEGARVEASLKEILARAEDVNNRLVRL